MAAASCVNTADEVMKSVIAVVVPGKGVAACQAAPDNTPEIRCSSLVTMELPMVLAATVGAHVHRGLPTGPGRQFLATDERRMWRSS
jgi:hypothetical protein